MATSIASMSAALRRAQNLRRLQAGGEGEVAPANTVAAPSQIAPRALEFTNPRTD